MTKDDIIDAIKVHRFEPGDRVVLRVPGQISPEQGAGMREAFKEWAPGVKVIILTGGIEMEVVRGVPEQPQP